MRKLQCTMMFVCVLALPRSTFAQEGWNFSVDFFNLSNTGNDAKQVEIFTNNATIRGSGTELQSALRVDYGADFQPIQTKFPNDRTLLFTGGYSRGTWGVKVRRWSTAGEWSWEERVVSPPMMFNSTPTSESMSLANRGCRMWGHSITPVVDSREESGSSPVNCHAANSHKTSKTDLLFERPITQGPVLRSVLQFGVSIGTVKNLRSEGQSMMAFEELPPGIPLPPAFVDGKPTTVLVKLENPITLESVSESSGRFVGPNFGIDGSFDLKRFRIGFNLNSAVLLGKAKDTGEWTDIDQISAVAIIGGERVTHTEHLEGHHPYAVEKRVALSVFESHIKGSYRIRDWLSVGAGFFLSSWFGVPQAPSWEVPGAWTNGEGSGWKQNKASSVFYGLSYSVQLTF